MKRSLLLLAVGLTLAAACGDSQPEGSPAADLPTTSTTAHVPATSTTALADAAFPVTVATDIGDVTIEREPRRIVSLSATHTEILYAVGAGGQLAATDLTSNYPSEANETVKVDAFNFNAEEVAAVDPDLVILAFDSFGEVEALGALGIPTILLLPAATLDDVYRQVGVVGEATGHGEEARLLVDDMQTAIERAIGAVSAEAVGLSVFHEIDSTLFSANSETLVGHIYARLGMRNIADDVPDEFGAGYVQLSPEAILAQDPDFIFLGDAAFGESGESVGARPGWRELSAVKTGRIVELDADIAGRWGPRTVELVEQIAVAVTTGGAGR